MRIKNVGAFAFGTLLAVSSTGLPAAGQLYEDDPFVGTWELNVDASIYDPGPPPRSQRRTYEATPQGLKATIITVDDAGTVATVEYAAGYDQVDVPFEGSPIADRIAVERIDRNTAKATLTSQGRVVGTALRIVTTDRSRMTFSIQLAGDLGSRNLLVFDRVRATPSLIPSADPFVGTWELDLERSIYDPGPPPRSQRRVYESTPEGLKATITTVDAQGTTSTVEYVAGYDRVDVPFLGDTSIADVIRLERVNLNTAVATLVHAGDQVGTARRVVSADGEEMTFTLQMGGDSRNLLFFRRVD